MVNIFPKIILNQKTKKKESITLSLLCVYFFRDGILALDGGHFGVYSTGYIDFEVFIKQESVVCPKIQIRFCFWKVLELTKMPDEQCVFTSIPFPFWCTCYDVTSYMFGIRIYSKKNLITIIKVLFFGPLGKGKPAFFLSCKN